jgi:hypothetical protein
MSKSAIKYTISALTALALLYIWVATGPGLAQRPVSEEPIRITHEFPAPKITKAGEYHSVTMEGLPKLQRPGLPMLPIKAAKVLVPPGRNMKGIRVICGRKMEIAGAYVVKPGQRPVPLSYTGPVTLTLPSPEVYDSSEPFPGVLRSEVSMQGKRGYEILVLTLYPVEYIPQEGKLFYYEDMTVEVDTEPAPEKQNRMLRRNPRHWAEDKKEIREMVDNPEVAESYRIPDEMGGGERILLDPGTPYDYVIITNEALNGAPGPNNFQALVSAKQARAIDATIVTTEWIYANYNGMRPDGGTDNQTKIRNFIIDAYQTWGTEYILLGGDGDGGNVGGESGDEIIPHRGFYGYVSTWPDPTIDDDIPADMYYGCLDGTFDNDGDGIYGEPTDGPGGGEVDLFAEVYVGRVAVDSEDELSNLIAKALAYEDETDQYLRDVWMVGEDLECTAPWGGDRKDDIKDGSSAAGYTTVGFENSPYATFFDTQTLYDRDYPGYDWPQSEIIGVINSPAHIINHLGHASVTYVMKMYNSDVDSSLTNGHYFIGYSQGCYAGAFDNRDAPSPHGSGGYLPQDSISEHLTNEAYGAVAFISNSRFGWGHETDPHLGASQYYDRQFWDAVLGESIFNIGKANQDSKEDTYNVLGTGGFDSIMRWVYYELNVFGDPELRVKTTAGPPPEPTPTPTSEPPPPPPADLKQASDLEFSPPDPSVGDTVHFWFKVRNDGEESIEVTEIGPFGYGPNHTPWDANRHGNLEIAANGGEETIHGYRTFEEDEAGVWTVDGIHYQLVSDPEPRSYYDLPANGYRAAGMDVVVRGPSDLRQCLDLEIHPDPPIMLGEEVRFCTDLCNYGDQPSVFKYFGPEGRDPNNRNWDAFIEGSFSVPPDSHPYTYDMFGRYYKVGEWCIDRLAVQVNDDWLTRYTLPSDGHLQSFCFDVMTDPDHLITFVEVIGSDREYRVVENLGVGDRYYTDRDYTILSLPEGFEDLTWIMTSNEDDRQTREEFLYFALNNDADVCIAYDQRVDPLPNWMDDFEDTGLFLEVSDGMASPLRIYCRHYPLGKVMLGGNLASGAGHSGPVSNYVILAKTPCILFGDFDSNGQVDVLDIQWVASRWRMTDDDPDWDARYDLNGDGIITVVDIMLVAAHWDERCE